MESGNSILALFDFLIGLVIMVTVLGAALIVVWYVWTRGVPSVVTKGSADNLKQAMSEIAEALPVVSDQKGKPVMVDEATLSDVYIQLNGVTGIIAVLYGKYKDNLVQLTALDRCKACFEENGDQVSLIKPIELAGVCEALADKSIVAMVGNTNALAVTGYVKRLYLSIVRAIGQNENEALQYQSSGEQLFDEVMNIKSRVSAIKTHNAALDAANTLDKMDKEITRLESMLVIDGSNRSVVNYKRMVAA